MATDDQDDDERDLFRKAVGQIRAVKQDKIHPHRKRRKPVPDQTLRDQREVMNSLLSDAYEPADIETGDELLYTRPGLQHSVIRKLRRGQYAIEAELDLHGATSVQAREAVNIFLKKARDQEKRVVRIIHGKGKSSEGKLPVLKGKVNSWLRQKGEVLAFCSARPNDGGTGAVYVLLKRKT
ncbi:MAG: Smr/MutS family protein [Gammaproteobacteria bacterium]|nr:Smr/MutS family protein [Gammaproteobacteria bacterium]